MYWFPHRPEDGVESPRTGVTGGCKSLNYGYWELKSGPVH